MIIKSGMPFLSGFYGVGFYGVFLSPLPTSFLKKPFIPELFFFADNSDFLAIIESDC